MSNFLIFDAHAILHRAYHALPPLTNKKGEMTNAVYGFLLVFLKVLKEFEPKYIAVCFDTDASTFRDKMYKEYKANRVETDEALEKQIPMIQDILGAFGISMIQKDGYEADDCIGTLAVWGKKHLFVGDGRDRPLRGNIIIVTGDMDTLQLVNDQVSVYTLRKGMSDTVLMTPQVVKERYGIDPSRVIDWKALKGDASDNIPGVKGVGEKTATELIQQFHSIDNLYRHLSDVASDSVRKKLETGQTDARLSYKLAAIDQHVPLKIDLNAVAFQGFDEGKITEKFLEYGFRSLVARIPSMKTQGQFFFSHLRPAKQSFGAQEPVLKGGKIGNRKGKAANPPKLERAKADTRAVDRGITLARLDKSNYSQLEQEWRADGLVIRWYQEEAPGACNPKSYLGLYSRSSAVMLEWDELRKHRVFLDRIFSSHEIKKIGCRLKWDYRVLKNSDFHLANLWFDIEIAAYLLDPGKRSYELSELAAEYLDISRRGEFAREWTSEGVQDRWCDGSFAFELYDTLSAELRKRGQQQLLHSFEMPLVSILADMELRGILLDVGYLKKLGSAYDKKLRAYQKKILKLAGMKFNVNSPKQLKEVLFEKLGISARTMGRTKTGISTGAEELEKIRGEHPIVPLVLDYRELFKLQSTYVLALPKTVDSQKRVHTTFNQTVVATGRLSSQDPNLQNIPIRGEQGGKLRRAFIAAQGWKLVSADYSQFELRVVASLSRDLVLTRAFRSGGDIHAKTASVIFNIPEKKVTLQQRRDAKVINFGIIYGLGARGLAQTTGMAVSEAREFIGKYFEIHKGVKKFFDTVLKDAREKGYVETLFGRRRFLPDLNAPQEFLRSAAERQALNHPIQGSQADLLKLAMIHVQRRIEEEGLADHVHMLLQVHDELVFEVRDKVVVKAKKIIEHELVHVYKLWVPIEVEIGVGKNWAECHK